MSETAKIVQTVAINLFIFTLGLHSVLVGSTLLDLTEVYSSTVKIIAYTITTRSAGAIIVSLSGGLAFKLFNSQLVCILATIILAISSVLTPSCGSVMGLYALNFIVGMAVCVAEIGTTIALQVLWIGKSGVMLQLYNFFYGLGAILAPLLAAPFLSPHRILNVEGADALQTTNSTWNLTDTFPTTTLSEDAIIADEPASRIWIPYYTVGLTYLLSIISMIIGYCADSRDLQPDRIEYTPKENPIPRVYRVMIVLLVTLYQTSSAIVEVAFSSLVATFVVSEPSLLFTKAQGAYLASSFWFFFTFSLIFASILLLKVPLLHLMALLHIVYVLASVAQLFFLAHSSWVVWVTSAVIACGLSPYYGSGYAWANQFIVLGRVASSVMTLSNFLGTMLPALIISPYLESHPMVFIYFNIAMAGVLSLIVAALRWFDALLKSKNYSLCSS